MGCQGNCHQGEKPCDSDCNSQIKTRDAVWVAAWFVVVTLFALAIALFTTNH